MKSYIIALPIIAMLVISTAIAQAQVSAQAKIQTLGVLGEGLAVSTTNPADFKVVRIGIARVLTNIAGTESEFNVGVLFLDADRYAINNTVIGNGTSGGDIYLNNTKVGSFSANRVVKPGRDVWYGTMTVNGASYNLYVVAAQRPIKASEAADDIKDYCKDNPVKCGVVAKAVKGIGNTCANLNSTSCRDKIVQYCQNNPTDARCVTVFRAYCTAHTDDSRCVQELKLFCSKNPTNDKCVSFCSKYTNVCTTGVSGVEPERNVTNATAVATETNETENETGTTINGS